MAKATLKLRVETTHKASVDLAEIWLWNAEHYDVDQANKYSQYLQNESDKLSTEFSKGQPVPGHPKFRSHVIRKRRGHGHVAVYKVENNVVQILHSFHTSQDWLNII